MTQAPTTSSDDAVLGPVVVLKPESSRRRMRLSRLTGLRVFAALGVVLVHVGYHFTSSSTVDVAEAYGYTGVTFFYLLSGFVLSWSQPKPRPARFWWSRVARIWPLTVLLTAFAFTVIAAQERIPGPLGHAANFLLFQAWLPRGSWYFGGNGVSWSLSCELFFYLCFPFLIIPIRRFGWRALALAAAGTVLLQLGAPTAAALMHMPSNIYFWLFFIFPPYRLLEFLLGMLLARMVTLGLRVRWPRATIGLAVAGLGALAVAFTTYTVLTGNYLDRPFVALAVIPGLLMLILAAATQDLRGIRSWACSGLLVVLGECSFELYLLHKPLYLFTSRFGWWENGGHLRGWGLLLVFIVLALLVSIVVHKMVGSPLYRVLRHLPDNLRAWCSKNRWVSGHTAVLALLHPSAAYHGLSGDAGRRLSSQRARAPSEHSTRTRRGSEMRSPEDPRRGTDAPPPPEPVR